MPGFLYYIPKPDPRLPVLELASGRGLDYAFGGVPPERITVGCGPDGHGGFLLADYETAKKLGRSFVYSADRQRWQRLKIGDQDNPSTHAWVGYCHNGRPGPNDLLRKDAISGPVVQLADGCDWIVPRACTLIEIEGGCLPDITLPRTLDFDEYGEWIPGSVVPRWRPLWSIACRWINARLRVIAVAANRIVMMDDGDRRPPEVELIFDNPLVAAGEVLAHNYRIGLTELVLLRSFVVNGGEVPRILDACCDAVTLDGWIERNAESVINMPKAFPIPEGQLTEAGV